ncbi:MAG: class I SAM-dependent methyltransferase [Acidobacteria bacterium]|nr:class I SAM-dependent methyltransferase [Acidobacteriota bacterium]
MTRQTVGNPDWMWNEMRQVGTDYADTAEVAAYDARMASFRDVNRENQQTLALLELAPGSKVLEIGCGTGRFARAAARAGLESFAVDISEVMLRYLAEKAQEEGLKLAGLQHAGFLTMSFPPGHFNAAVSGAALHHLPDAWKLVALLNVARVLRPGGRFLLGDVVFSLSPDETPEECFERFCASLPGMRLEAARHAAAEFSTYDWILEGLIERAGFEIESRTAAPASFIRYLCRKT